MTSAKEGRNSIDTPKSPGASKEDSTQGMYDAFITRSKVMKRQLNLRVSQVSNRQALSSSRLLIEGEGVDEA
jgi:cysteine synthase